MDRDSYLRAFRTASKSPAGSASRNLAGIYDKLQARPNLETEGRKAPSEPRGRWAAGVFFIKSVGLSVAIGCGGLGLVAAGVAALQDRKPAPVVRPRVTIRPLPVGLGETTAATGRRPSGAPALPAPTQLIVPPPASETQPQRTVAIPTVEAPSAPVPGMDRDSSSVAVEDPADRLSEELALMRSAERAMGRDDESEALDQLAEHRRRFPHGALAPERDALETKIRSRSGSADPKPVLPTDPYGSREER